MAYQTGKLTIIPKQLHVDANLQFERLKQGMSTESVSFKYAGRPRFIHMETTIKDGALEFVDFPTILAGINHAISNLMPNDFNALTPDYTVILDRELNRFILTLKKLLLKHGFDEMVCIKRVEQVDKQHSA